MAQIAGRRNLATVQNELGQFGPHFVALTQTVVGQNALGQNQNYLDFEHNVNGVWNAILNIMYPVADMDFLINPEAYPLQGQQNGARADMIVRALVRNQNGPGYIAGQTFTYFEGKGQNNAMNAGAIRQQMEDYLDQAIGNVQGRACWAIGAKGHQVWFYRYTTRNVGNARMVPVGWNANANPPTIDTPNQNAGQFLIPYSVAAGLGGAPGDWATIQLILKHMSQNYAPF